MDILKTWKKFQSFPAGSFLFSKMLSRNVPYSGSVNPQILKLEAGHAIVAMKDRHFVRNHLQSVHAIALINIAELSTGLALSTSIPKDARAIIKGLSIEYLKKARGTITAEAQQAPIASTESKEYFLESILKNETGEIVAKAKAHWLVGPKK